MMAARSDPKVLRKVRDMIRAGYTNAEIAKACGVSVWSVNNQSALIARFEGRVDRSENRGGLEKIATQAKARAAKGQNNDPEAMDLVDIFATPRTICQLRRFSERDT